jgi:hypothetical protein
MSDETMSVAPSLLQAATMNNLEGQIVSQSLEASNQIKSSRMLGSSLGATDWQKNVLNERLGATATETAIKLEVDAQEMASATGKGSLLNKIT